MKSELLIKKVLCFALVIFSALLFSVSAYAVDGEATQPATEYVEQETTEYVPEETQIQTQAPTEAPVQTQAPQVETEPPYQPETQAQEATNAPTAAANYVDTTPETTSQVQIPTIAKTVSTKTYSTNNIAGMVSWVCVIIGVLVVIIVLISTKVGGHKNGRQRFDGGDRINSSRRQTNEEYYARR